MLHGSRAETQALRLRPQKPDVVPAPLALEGRETSQATFSKAGSGPVAAQAEAVHVKKQRHGGGGAPFTWTPSPSSLLLLVLFPSPSSCLLQGQEAVRGASSPQERVPSFFGGFREQRVIIVRLSSTLFDGCAPQGGGTEGGQGSPDPASPVPVAAAPLHPGRDLPLKGDGKLAPT